MQFERIGENLVFSLTTGFDNRVFKDTGHLKSHDQKLGERIDE